jgi:peptidoglycan/LPS O-acetylase OafA/YrhL
MTIRDNRPALNAMRGFAALTVVIYHFRYFSPFPWFDAFPGLALGYLGVDFFFTLSGLVISHVYLNAFIARRSSQLDFLAFRLSRLFPLHAAIMLAMPLCWLAIGKSMGERDAIDWISLTLLIHQWTLPPAYVWNAPAWSVSAEMFAYTFIFPITVVVARACRMRVAGLYLLGFGIFLLGILFSRAGTLNIVPGPAPLIRVTGGFMIGSGIYCLLSPYRPAPVWNYALAAGGALLLMAIWLGSEPLTLAAVVAVMVAAYMAAGKISAALSWGPLYRFGEISFALYLCHIPLFTLAKFWANSAGTVLGPWLCLATAAICLLVASALHLVVELPARAALRRRWDSLRQPPVAASGRDIGQAQHGLGENG